MIGFVAQAAIPGEPAARMRGRMVMRGWLLRFVFGIVILSSGFVLPPISAHAADGPFAVGVRQVEYREPKQHRMMWMAVFYPAAAPAPDVARLRIPFVIDVNVYSDAPIADDGKRHPLIMLSHGRGSDAWQYAWLAEQLAARGYIVAAPNHYHANTYDREIAYLANKIWQRPIDISLDISFLLNDPFWRAHIDPARIGVAGHSQGGFTALWIGGARVNADKFLAFQRLFINNKLIPQYIRSELPLDATPALNVQDRRVKAVFAMAPGIVQDFGMDEAGLRRLDVPAFLTVGAGDTQTPPKSNAEFAARYIPDAQLWVIPGPVGHEIFINECDDEGRDEFPEGCIDAAGVDRHALHDQIAAAALKFFGEKLSGH
jgi:predicted dienelactone hydrolase